MTTITADDILVGLWHIVNESPRRTSGLTNGQIAALKLLMEIRGYGEFITTLPSEEIERLLHRLWDFARRGKMNESRPALRRRALVTWIALRIMRCREKTDEEWQFYWRHGYWRNQLLM